MITKTLQEAIYREAVEFVLRHNNPPGKGGKGGQRELARKFKSPSADTYINHLVTEKWREKETVIPENFWHDLVQFFRMDDQHLYDTDVLRQTMGLLTICKEDSISGLVDAPTGSGKTEACKEFVRVGGKAVYLITCAGDMKVKQLVESVYKAVVDKNCLGKTISEMRQDIQTTLGQRWEEKPLLIFDEAENLKPQAYQVIKALYDGLVENNKAGMVLLGANQYADHLYKQAHRKNSAYASTSCMPQIWRRFKNNRIVLSGLTEAEAMNICLQAGITDKALTKQIVASSEYYSDVFAQVGQWKKQQKAV